eukprot:CAMPEP_0194351202 /NCGR_PEP_ID=MMETSP0171-20130528/108047_1 /TAXON_ID=218684 /ORGANISM="Corethron pennatum, Strain L29A3" /LENGTH=40 /DNA_ID= /DNA_START= /DNA_END= /DNA_ORIENTATION=
MGQLENVCFRDDSANDFLTVRRRWCGFNALVMVYRDSAAT